MARIQTYQNDLSIDGSEKLIGTNNVSSSTTNFVINDIADWMNSHSVIGIAGQTVYKFQSLVGDGRDRGSISFEGYGGQGTLFSDITTMRISKYNLRNVDITAYLNWSVGKDINFFDVNNVSSFGIYAVESLTPVDGTDFFDIVLRHDTSNGSLQEGSYYGISVQSSNEFTEPSLATVTTEGNTTTNSIQVGGLTVTGTFKNYDEATPDIGAKQDNDLRGYGDKYISNKTIAYSRISSAAFDEEGAIRIKDNVFQTYIGGEWQDVVTNFRFREDENGNFELEHKPIGFTGWIEVNSGNSDLLGLNGLPITQNYATSMGAYPVPLTLDGGTF